MLGNRFDRDIHRLRECEIVFESFIISIITTYVYMKNQIKQVNKSTIAEADEEEKQEDNSSSHSSPPQRKKYKKVPLAVRQRLI